jgi:hypothetical protein
MAFSFFRKPTTGKLNFKHSLRRRLPKLNSRKRSWLQKDADVKKFRQGGFSKIELRKLRSKWSGSSKDPFSRGSAKRITRGLRGL